MSSKTCEDNCEDYNDGVHNYATLSQSMQLYIIPLFLFVSFWVVWGMVFIKAKGGTLTKGRGGGWCRTCLLILCFFQSFLGWLGVFSTGQLKTVPYMMYPLIGFIAFNGNNRRWLLIYIGLNFFAYQYSGQAIVKDAWMASGLKTPAANPFNDDRKGRDQYEDGSCAFWDCDDYCDPDQRPPNEKCIMPPNWASQNWGGMAMCWSMFRSNSFCGYGWLRFLNIMSTFLYFSWWFTAFAACSWWAEDAEGGDSSAKTMQRTNTDVANA